MFMEAVLILREFGDLGGVALTLGSLARDAMVQDDLEQLARLLDEWLAVKHEIFPDDDNADVKFIGWNWRGARAITSRPTGCYRKSWPRSNARAIEIGLRRCLSFRDALRGRKATPPRRTHCAWKRWSCGARPATRLRWRIRSTRWRCWPRSAAGTRKARNAPPACSVRPSRITRRSTGIWAIAPIWRPEHERGVAAVRATLGEARFATLWAEGEAMRLEDAYEYALESW